MRSCGVVVANGWGCGGGCGCALERRRDCVCVLEGCAGCEGGSACLGAGGVCEADAGAGEWD